MRFFSSDPMKTCENVIFGNIVSIFSLTNFFASHCRKCMYTKTLWSVSCLLQLGSLETHMVFKKATVYFSSATGVDSDRATIFTFLPGHVQDT